MITFEEWWVEEKGHPPTYEQRDEFETAHRAFNYVVEQNAYRLEREKELRKQTERQSDRLRKLWFEAEARVQDSANSGPKQVDLPAPTRTDQRRTLRATQDGLVVNGHLIHAGENVTFVAVKEGEHLYWERQ